MTELLPLMLEGAWVTVQITFFGSLLAIVAALIGALGRLSPIKPLRWLAIAYIEVFRGSSLLVQLFWLYFVLPMPPFNIALSAFNVAVIGLGLNIGAYGAEVLRGASEAAASGGWVVAGGHTIDDPEPKYGLAVTGTVHPDRVWRNGGARPGDVLILTKPIGCGVLLNANIKKLVSAQAMAACLDANLQTPVINDRTSWQEMLDAFLGNIPPESHHCFVEIPHLRPAIQAALKDMEN